MFESSAKEESEVPMTRVSDALRATGADEYCSDDMDDDDHDVEESKLIELNNLIQQIKLKAAPDSIDVLNLKEDGHKNQMLNRCEQTVQPWQKSPPQNQVQVYAMTVELNKIKEENTLLKVEVAEILSIKEKLEKDLYDKSDQLNELKKENVDLKKNEKDLKERLTLTEAERNKIVQEKSDLDSALKALIEEIIDLEQKLIQLLEDTEKYNEQLIDLQKNNEIIEAKNISIIEERNCLNAEIKDRMLEMERIKKVSKAKTAETEALFAQNEVIKSLMAKHEERAKRVLTYAKAKIEKVELENRELQMKLTTRVAGNALQSQVSKEEEMNSMKAAFVAQIHSLREAKKKAEEANKEEIMEKLKLTGKNKALEEELKQCKISLMKYSNLKIKKTQRKIIKEQKVHVEKKVLKLEEEMKVLKKQSGDKNEQLMKLGRHFMEVLTLAENENSSNNDNTERNRQKPSGLSNGRLSQNSPRNEKIDNPESNSSILVNCQLFVYGVDEHIKRHELLAEFGKHGTVTDVYNTGNGYAFITYSSLAEAQDCLRSSNGRSMFGQTVQIKERTKKSNHGEGRSKDGYEGTDVHFRRKVAGEGLKGNLDSDSEKSEGKKKATHGLGDYDSKRSDDTWSNIAMSRTTAGHSSNRISKSKPKVTTKFILAVEKGDKSVDSVAVAGTFTGWVAVPLYFEKDCWVAKLEVTPGLHQYKFVVDGLWIHDDAKHSVANGSGKRINSILIDAKATEVYSSCLKNMKSGNPGCSGRSVKHPAVVVKPEPVKNLRDAISHSIITV